MTPTPQQPEIRDGVIRFVVPLPPRELRLNHRAQHWGARYKAADEYSAVVYEETRLEQWPMQAIRRAAVRAGVSCRQCEREGIAEPHGVVVATHPYIRTTTDDRATQDRTDEA